MLAVGGAKHQRRTGKGEYSPGKGQSIWVLERLLRKNDLGMDDGFERGELGLSW